MIKLKGLLKEAPEKDTKEFIKTLDNAKRHLNVFINALNLYRKSDRSIGEDYWYVHSSAMNGLEASFKKLNKIYLNKRKEYQKKHKR